MFLVLEVLPGNAAQTLMGAGCVRRSGGRPLAAKLGLDQPAVTRYFHWLGGMLLHGDLGNSYAYGSPVLELVAERLVVTVPLALMAMALTVVLALSAGVLRGGTAQPLGATSA